MAKKFTLFIFIGTIFLLTNTNYGNEMLRSKMRLATGEYSYFDTAYLSNDHIYKGRIFNFSNDFGFSATYGFNLFKTTIGTLQNFSTQDRLFNHSFVKNSLLFQKSFNETSFYGLLSNHKQGTRIYGSFLANPIYISILSNSTKSGSLDTISFGATGTLNNFKISSQLYLSQLKDNSCFGYIATATLPFKFKSLSNKVSISKISFSWDKPLDPIYFDESIDEFYEEINTLYQKDTDNFLLKLHSEYAFSNYSVFLNYFKITDNSSYLISSGVNVFAQQNTSIQLNLRKNNLNTKAVLKALIAF